MIRCDKCGVVIEVFKDLEDFMDPKTGLTADKLCCGDSGMLCDECGESKE